MDFRPFHKNEVQMLMLHVLWTEKVHKKHQSKDLRDKSSQIFYCHLTTI